MVSQRKVVALICGLAATAAAPAQESGALRWRSGSSPLGLQAGQPRAGVPCGSFAFSCSDATTVPLYASAKAPRSVAMQVSPADNPAMRSPQAQGFNVSVIGKAGIGWDLGVYGRVGTTFNRASPATMSNLGSEGGKTYGVGLSWDFSRSASAALGMDSYDVRSTGGEVRDVRTSLGLQWRY
jgi:OOP family OmpA-OmpF porin